MFIDRERSSTKHDFAPGRGDDVEWWQSMKFAALDFLTLANRKLWGHHLSYKFGLFSTVDLLVYFFDGAISCELHICQVTFYIATFPCTSVI
jgi:hypothetical protein